MRSHSATHPVDCGSYRDKEINPWPLCPKDLVRTIQMSRLTVDQRRVCPSLSHPQAELNNDTTIAIWLTKIPTLDLLLFMSNRMITRHVSPCKLPENEVPKNDCFAGLLFCGKDERFPVQRRASPWSWATTPTINTHHFKRSTGP